MTLAELTISNISKSVNEIEQAHLKHSKLFGKIKKRKEKTFRKVMPEFDESDEEEVKMPQSAAQNTTL